MADKFVLKCYRCGKEHPSEPLREACDCGGKLFVSAKAVGVISDNKPSVGGEMVRQVFRMFEGGSDR